MVEIWCVNNKIMSLSTKRCGLYIKVNNPNRSTKMLNHSNIFFRCQQQCNVVIRDDDLGRRGGNFLQSIPECSLCVQFDFGFLYGIFSRVLAFFVLNLLYDSINCVVLPLCHNVTVIYFTVYGMARKVLLYGAIRENLLEIFGYADPHCYHLTQLRVYVVIKSKRANNEELSNTTIMLEIYIPFSSLQTFYNELKKIVM